MNANWSTRIALCLLLALSVLGTLQIAHAKTFPEHYADTKAVFGETNKEFNELIRVISQDLIDERVEGLAGKHRIYFHWGFSDDIPRESLDEAVKAAMGSNPTLSEDQVKNKIIEEWKARVNRAIDLAESVTGLSRLQAKGVAGLVYYVHILGDYSTKDKTGLMPLQSIQKGLDKAMHQIFGNNSDTAVRLKEAIKTALEKGGTRAAVAQRVLQLLKKEIQIALETKSQLFQNLSASGLKCIELLVNVASSPAMSKFAEKCAEVNKKYDALFGSNQRLKTAVGAGLTATLFSSVGHGFKVINGEEELEQAVGAVAKDGALASTATYITSGIMTKIEEKWVLVAKVPKLQSGIGAGVAVFIFDETRTISSYVQGDMTTEEFVKNTGVNMSVGLASGAAAYVAVVLGATPGGFVVMAVSIGAQIVVHAAWNKIEQMNNKNYLFMEDLIGRMPLEVLNRRSFWNAQNNERPKPFFETYSPVQVNDSIENSLPFETHDTIELKSLFKE